MNGAGDHAPPLSFDDDANPRDGPAHRADDATNDYGPRSLRAATPATEIHRAGRETFRASFADHPASLLIDAAASRSDPFAARSRPASIASERRTPTRPRRVTPLARLHRKKPPCIARNGRAAAPARARGAFCADANPPALAASRPLHARTAKPRRARWQRSRRGSRPRQWGSASRALRPPIRRVGKCVAIRTLPTSPRHAPCTLVPR